MKTCEYAGAPFTEPRSHPWTDTTSSARFRYHDLVAEPALVRTALEDFVPWQRYAAIETFYGLLERLNGEGGALESNDCAFAGPHANESAVDATLECSGRIMVLHRALAENDAPRTAALALRLHRRLSTLEPTLELGMIGTTIVPVRYLALPAGAQLGHELMISFWAWGEDEAALMANLARVAESLAEALLVDD